MNKDSTGAEAMMRVIDEFDKTASMLAGMRATLTNRGFSPEAADHLVVLFIGKSIQDDTEERTRRRNDILAMLAGHKRRGR